MSIQTLIRSEESRLKTALVLLSGLLSNERLWKHQIDHLSEIASITVISAKEDSSEKMVREILEKAPAKFALAGHSMGGWLAQEIMRSSSSRVTKLCLLNTTAHLDSKEKREWREQLLQKAEENFPAVVKDLVERLVYNSSAKSGVEKMF